MENIKVDFTARERLIQECDKCKGKPKEESFDLGGMKGIKCSDCFQVVSWEGEKIQQKAKTKNKKEQEKVEIGSELPDDIKENTVYNSDTFEFTKKIKTGTFDLVIEDIPYGESYKSNNRKDKHIEIHNDDNLDWLPGHSKELYRIMKKDSHCYIFCGKKIDLIKPVLESVFDKIQICTWVKGGSMGDLEAEFHNSTEFILLCQKGRRKMNGKRQKNVFEYPVIQADTKEHPTPKPIKLLRALIQISSNEGEIIFDGFSGRGSVAIASVLERRRFVASELVKKYHKLSLKNVKLAQDGHYGSLIKIKETKNELGVQGSLF